MKVESPFLGQLRLKPPLPPLLQCVPSTVLVVQHRNSKHGPLLKRAEEHLPPPLVEHVAPDALKTVKAVQGRTLVKVLEQGTP